MWETEKLWGSPGWRLKSKFVRNISTIDQPQFSSTFKGMLKRQSSGPGRFTGNVKISVYTLSKIEKSCIDAPAIHPYTKQSHRSFTIRHSKLQIVNSVFHVVEKSKTRSKLPKKGDGHNLVRERKTCLPIPRVRAHQILQKKQSPSRDASLVAASPYMRLVRGGPWVHPFWLHSWIASTCAPRAGNAPSPGAQSLFWLWPNCSHTVCHTYYVFVWRSSAMLFVMLHGDRSTQKPVCNFIPRQVL